MVFIGRMIAKLFKKQDLDTMYYLSLEAMAERGYTPDSVEKTNTTKSMTSSYQIWHYYQANKNFVFRDQNGFGDYRLETPFIGRGL